MYLLLVSFSTSSTSTKQPESVNNSEPIQIDDEEEVEDLTLAPKESLLLLFGKTLKE
jgi:hypothetical protein